ncbi:NUDIX hydrolase [Hufsiella ginkgonis]|nr:NUDIX hydrolase [Hufsiella ginkgonis]
MNTKEWKLLSKEDISPSKWFPLERHHVQLPNGLVLDDYYLSPLGDVVMVLALTADQEVVLVKQYKHGLGQLLLELPGGMRQGQQTLVRSALNELEEETGIRAAETDLVPLGKLANNPTKTNQVTYGYLLFDAKFNSVQRLDTTEDIEVVTYPAPRALEMVLNGEIWVTDSVNFILKAALRYPEIFQRN